MNKVELRERIAKQVYLPLCGIPDEIDSEWLSCGENMQQNCRAIADDILKLVEEAGYVKLPPDSAIVTGIHHLNEIKDE